MLETLFGSKLRVKVLDRLFYHPDERYYVRQLAALLNEDSTNISRELKRLESAGILVSAISGKQKYYQADQKSPAFQAISGLLTRLPATCSECLTLMGFRKRPCFVGGLFLPVPGTSVVGRPGTKTSSFFLKRTAPASWRCS